MTVWHRTRLFLLYMILPCIMLGFGLLLAGTEWFASTMGMEDSDAVLLTNDTKLNRTVKGFRGTLDDKNNPARNEAVDQPGIIFRFTMLEELKSQFDIPLSFAGNEQVRSKPHEVLLSINGKDSFQALIHVHGHSSARGKRKSYCLNFVLPQRFTTQVAVKKILLLNMDEDLFGFEFKFAYELLEDMGLFLSYSQYAVLYINEEPQGLYLVVERPVDALQRQFPGVVSIFRKRVTEKLEPRFIKPGVDPWLLVANIEESLLLADKKLQAERLHKYVDLDAYFKWLAFNSLLQNGDTADELYLYEKRDKLKQLGRFGIMAWDCDELQSEISHVERMHLDELFWAAGQRLDKQILENPLLYQQYSLVLNELLTEVLTEDYLLGKLEQVRELVGGIDTGHNQQVQNKMRIARDIAIFDFKERLLERRIRLLIVLADRRRLSDK